MQALGRTFFRSVDIFDKFDNDELRLRTKAGAFLSFFLSTFGVLFITIKTYRFAIPKIHRDLSLTPDLIDQQDFVNISISIRVNLPCYFLHLDALDSLGFSQLDINSTANLRRVAPNGKVIGIVNETMQQICFPCYGALPDNVCCNSCEQLTLLHLFKGMPAEPDRWVQCREQKAPDVNENETCLVKGKISVNQVSGSFHIAPGRNDLNAGSGHHHNLAFSFPRLDLSHTIETLRFGPAVPTGNSPLNRVSVSQKAHQAMMYRYTLRATPLLYVKNGKEIRRGYEYTVVPAQTEVAGGMPPGIFFHYSFTPYRITVNAVSRSFAQYLTSTLGFLAGSFAGAMLLDLLIHKTQMVETLPKKKPEDASVPQ
jgi:hypothetical protein